MAGHYVVAEYFFLVINLASYLEWIVSNVFLSHKE